MYNLKIHILLLLCVVVSTSVRAQYGFGTNSPHSSSVVDMTAPNKGFLPPRMTREQMLAIPQPVEEGMMVYNTTVGCLAYYAKGAFNCISTPPVKCGDNMTVNHKTINGAPENVTRTYGTVSYKGKCWITKNLGAADQAGSFTDGGESKLGWYWQFNRPQGFKNNGGARMPATTWNATEDPAPLGWIQDNDPCALLIGLGWRIPTDPEWRAADVWDTGVQAYSSVLKLHAAGLITPLGGFGEQGQRGLYWSANNYSYMNVENASVYPNGAPHNYAFPLRCLRD